MGVFYLPHCKGLKENELGGYSYDIEYLTVEEGLCVQIMHHGPFDDEPATVALMNQYIKENGYRNDFSNGRLHHEIYMSDARKVAPEKWKTVIRHPICKKEVV